MGRPVVASRLGGLEELLGEGRGVLVDLFASTESSYDAPPRLPAQPVERLASAILDLLLDPAKAERVGEAGRRRALDRYDWNLLVDRVLEVYRGEGDPGSRPDATNR